MLMLIQRYGERLFTVLWLLRKKHSAKTARRKICKNDKSCSRDFSFWNLSQTVFLLLWWCAHYSWHKLRNFHRTMRENILRKSSRFSYVLKLTQKLLLSQTLISQIMYKRKTQKLFQLSPKGLILIHSFWSTAHSKFQVSFCLFFDKHNTMVSATKNQPPKSSD